MKERDTRLYSFLVKRREEIFDARIKPPTLGRDKICRFTDMKHVTHIILPSLRPAIYKHLSGFRFSIIKAIQLIELLIEHGLFFQNRSEERRVGKERRSRWSP